MMLMRAPLQVQLKNLAANECDITTTNREFKRDESVVEADEGVTMNLINEEGIHGTHGISSQPMNVIKFKPFLRT